MTGLDKTRQAIPKFNKEIDVSKYKINKIVALLDKVAEGVVTPYSEINSAIGGDVQSSDYQSLAGARRVLRKDCKKHFTTISGVGLERAVNDRITEHAGENIHKIRATARHGLEVNNCADTDKLSREDKQENIRIHATLNVFLTISERTVDSAVITRLSNPLAPEFGEELLKLYGKQKKHD